MAGMRANLIAGISVAGLLIPEAIAYAAIAGLAPGRALFAAVVGGLAYALVGRSRFAIVAPTSSSAAILAATLASLTGSDATKAMMAMAVVAIIGLLFIMIAALRLGNLASFVARPVLHGFAFGLAMTIIIRQLPILLGLDVHESNIFALSRALLTNISATNIYSLAIGAGALALLFGLKRFQHVPGVLIVLLSGTAVSSLANLQMHGVSLVGKVTLTFDQMSIPPFDYSLWSRLVQLALPLTLILFAESWGTMRTLALRRGDSLLPNREFAALGFANLASALVHGMPVGAGFSAGSANESAGATSRLSAVFAAAGVGAIALLATPLIARIPQPVLAAVVITALTHALAIGPIRRLFQIDRDQWVAFTAAFAVIAFGIVNGMLIAIALSIGALLRRLAYPRFSELGQLGSSRNFVDIARHPDAAAIPGFAIFRPNAPLFFANAEQCLSAIAAACIHRPPGTVLVLSLEESDDLDSSAIETLVEFKQLLASRSMHLHLARAHDHVRDLLSVANMEDLAQHASFSVADAVAAMAVPSSVAATAPPNA